MFLRKSVIAIKFPFILCPFSLFVLGFVQNLGLKLLLQPFITHAVNTFSHTEPHTATHNGGGQLFRGSWHSSMWHLVGWHVNTCLQHLQDRHTISGQMKTFVQLQATERLWCLAGCAGTVWHIKVKSFMCLKPSKESHSGTQGWNEQLNQRGAAMVFRKSSTV